MVAWLQRLCFLVSTAYFDDLMAAAQLQICMCMCDVWVSLHLDAVFCFGAAVSFPLICQLITISSHSTLTWSRGKDAAGWSQTDSAFLLFCCRLWRWRLTWSFGQFLLSNRFTENCIHCFSIQNRVQTSLAKFSSTVLIKRTWISVKASGEVGEWWRCVLAGSSGKRTAVALMLRLSLKWL